MVLCFIPLLLATADASISSPSGQPALTARSILEATDSPGNETFPFNRQQIPSWQFWRQPAPTDRNKTGENLSTSPTPSKSNASEVPQNAKRNLGNSTFSDTSASSMDPKNTSGFSFARRWAPRWPSAKEVVPLETAEPRVEDSSQTPVSTRLDAHIRAWAKGKQTIGPSELPVPVNLDASSNATESRRAVVLWLLSASSSTRSIAADSLEKLRLNRAALAKNAALVATNATHIAKAALLYKFPVGLVAAASVYQTVRRKSVWEELGLFSLQGVAGGEDAIGCCLDAGDGAFLRPGGGAPWPQVRLAVRRRVEYLAAQAVNEKDSSQEALVAAVMAIVPSAGTVENNSRDASENVDSSSVEMSNIEQVSLSDDLLEEKHVQGKPANTAESNASSRLSPVSEAAVAVVVAKEAHLKALSDALAVRCIRGADHRVAYVRALGTAANILKETAANLTRAQATYTDEKAKVVARQAEEEEKANVKASLEATQERSRQKKTLQLGHFHSNHRGLIDGSGPRIWSLMFALSVLFQLAGAVVFDAWHSWGASLFGWGAISELVSEVIGAGAAFPLLLKLFGTSTASILACLFGVGTVAWVPPQLAEPAATAAAAIGAAAFASGPWVNRGAAPDSRAATALPPESPHPQPLPSQTQHQNNILPSFPNMISQGQSTDEVTWPAVGIALVESELAEALLRVTRDAILRSLSSEPTAFEVEATGIEQSTLEKCWRVRQSNGRNKHYHDRYWSAASDAEERTAVCSMVRTLELRRLGHLQYLLLHRPKDLPASAATANVRGSSSSGDIPEVALSHWVSEVHEWTSSVRAAVRAVVSNGKDGYNDDLSSVPGLFDAMARDGVGAVLLAFASRGVSTPSLPTNTSAPVAAVTLSGGSQAVTDEWEQDLAGAIALPAARVRLLVALELATSAEATSWQRHVNRLRHVLGHRPKRGHQQQRLQAAFPSPVDATHEQKSGENIADTSIDAEDITRGNASPEIIATSESDSSTETMGAEEINRNNTYTDATNEGGTAEEASSNDRTSSVLAAAPVVTASASRSSGALGWITGNGLRRDRFLVRLPSGRLLAVPVRKPLQFAARMGAAVMAHRWLKDSPHVDSLGKMAKHQSRLLWRTTRGILERRFAVPLRGAASDLLNRVPRLTDDRALSDAESSLVQMVDNFLAEVEPGLSAEERATRAATLDPKLISPAYEAELKKNVVKNFFTGKMVKMMLIQVQFLKRELFKAMEALDEVVDSNRLNVQLLAAVPAFGLAFAGAKVGAKLWFAVRTRRVRSAGAVLADAGVVLGDLERLLALDGSSSSSGCDDWSPSLSRGSSLSENTTEALEVGRAHTASSRSDVLSAQGLGELCVGLHRYQELLDTAAISSRGVPKMLRFSSENAKQAIEADLRRLLSPGSPHLTKQQQLVLVRRAAKRHAALAKSY